MDQPLYAFPYTVHYVLSLMFYNLNTLEYSRLVVLLHRRAKVNALCLLMFDLGKKRDGTKEIP